MSNSRRPGSPGKSPGDVGDADERLADVEDGCGCVEVWEHLSERRNSD